MVWARTPMSPLCPRFLILVAPDLVQALPSDSSLAPPRQLREAEWGSLLGCVFPVLMHYSSKLVMTKPTHLLLFRLPASNRGPQLLNEKFHK